MKNLIKSRPLKAVYVRDKYNNIKWHVVDLVNGELFYNQIISPKCSPLATPFMYEWTPLKNTGYEITLLKESEVQALLTA